MRRFSACLFAPLLMSASMLAAEPVQVTVDNFATAETHAIMRSYVEKGGFGQFFHFREPVPLDKQDVVRMNRDTLYSAAVFDLTNPVTIVKPASDRFQSMLAINENHSMLPAFHEDGSYTFGHELAGTRYIIVIFRTFADPNDPEDIAAANALQDRIEVHQADPGSFETPDWDAEGLAQLRDAIKVLGNTRSDTTPYFGQKALLNPLYHLIGTAVGWGGNPPEAAMYEIGAVAQNDGTPHAVTAKDVPVKGFWSITVYSAEGYMEPNDLGVNSYNNVTATPDEDDSYTIHFGGCEDGRVNCIPVMPGWGYAVRLYQPEDQILTGAWTFPAFQPLH